MAKLALIDKPDAPKRRCDERIQTWYRSDRMIESHGKWYFYTREGTMEGPFTGRFEAAVELDNYIKRITGQASTPSRQNDEDTVVRPLSSGSGMEFSLQDID